MFVSLFQCPSHHTHKPRAVCISFGETTPLQSMHSNLVPRPAGSKVVISPEVVVKEDGVASQRGQKEKTDESSW